MVRLLSHWKLVPPESRTWRLWLCVFIAGLAGAARGLDEGIISNSVRFKSFQTKFGITEDGQPASDILAMMGICAIGGALLGYGCIDVLGRVRCLQITALLWIIGSTVWITADSLAAVYVGRAIAGIGIGLTPVSSPVYLSEIAPAPIRGLAVSWFSMSVYVGILLGYFCNYGVSLHVPVSNAQWQIPIVLNFIFATILLVGTLFLAESPRYLVKIGDMHRARRSLSWLRHRPFDHHDITVELAGIEHQIEVERNMKGGYGFFGACRELFLLPSNRYKLFLCLTIQILGQLSGGGSYTVFAPKFFALVGKTGNVGLLTTGLFGVLKLLASLACALFVIDYLGRTRAVTIGIVLQGVTALYMALYLKYGYLGKDFTNPTSSQKHAANAALASIFIAGIGWAFGVNSIQYLVNAEIFSVRVRALGSGLTMMTHFAMQYASNRSTNPMMKAMNTWGLFLWYFAVCVLLLIFVRFFLPETAGFSLEEMEMLFDLPWYRIGLASRQPFHRAHSPARYSLELNNHRGSGINSREDQEVTPATAVAPAGVQQGDWSLKTLKEEGGEYSPAVLGKGPHARD